MNLSEEEITLFEIAYLLHIPVYKLVDEMPYDELLGWIEYFKLRPPEWRDDNRAIKILQSNGFKGDPGKVFPSLHAISKPLVKDAADSIKYSAIAGLISRAVGGDKIGFTNDQDQAA